MALYIPHSIFHLARLLYVRPETFGPHCVCSYRSALFSILFLRDLNLLVPELSSFLIRDPELCETSAWSGGTKSPFDGDPLGLSMRWCLGGSHVFFLLLS